MYDLICDVICFCVWRCDMGKVNVHYESEKKQDTTHVDNFVKIDRLSKFFHC